MGATLAWLVGQVDGAEQYAESAARGTTGPDWNAVRQGYGLPPSVHPPGIPVPEPERLEVLAALRRYAEHQLSLVPVAPGEEAQLAGLRTRLAALGQPPASPAPATTGGLLGGVFANAAAGKSWEDGGGRSHQVTLRCPHCGAQQERARDFMCRYCGRSIVAPQQP